jgi:chemotaxis protein methyltransferase CheR
MSASFSLDLSPAMYDRIAHLMESHTGVSLRTGREELVKARLQKRLAALKLPNFEAYVRTLEGPEGRVELGLMLDLLTTNKTEFFREVEHFEHLRANVVLPKLGKTLRLWSAACSSGQEPYSLAMLLRNELSNAPGSDARILATDVSTRVLEKAAKGEYAPEEVAGVSAPDLSFHFDHHPGPRGPYVVKPEIRALVRFARLNLLDPWPMTGPFDAIFCRNVMIYFQKELQAQLIRRFWDLVAPGGFLYVGLAESLSGIADRFKYCQPAVYRKPTEGHA